jgi:hypothetical protein
MIKLRSLKRKEHASFAVEQELLVLAGVITGKQFTHMSNTVKRYISDSALYASTLRQNPNIGVPTNTKKKP